MTIQTLPKEASASPVDGRKAGSALVRRLVRAHDDPGKQRIREWLGNIDDNRLIAFGLTPWDIAVLRGTQSISCNHCK
jgi:hypothetical protein